MYILYEYWLILWVEFSEQYKPQFHAYLEDIPLLTYIILTFNVRELMVFTSSLVFQQNYSLKQIMN